MDGCVCEHSSTHHYTCRTRKHLQQSCRHIKAQAVTSKGSTLIKASAEIGMELPLLSREQEASVYINVF